MNKIKREIVSDKEYETGWSEEYQDDSRMEDSITVNEHEQYDVIQMAEVEHDEDSKLFQLFSTSIQLNHSSN